MVDDKPDVLDFVCIDLERVLPGFVAVARGAPEEIPDVGVANGAPSYFSGGCQFTIGIPISVQLGLAWSDPHQPNKH